MCPPQICSYKATGRKLHLTSSVIISVPCQQNEITSAVSAHEGMKVFPLKRQYGQREKEKERGACQGRHMALTQGHTRLTAHAAAWEVHSESKAEDYL